MTDSELYKELRSVAGTITQMYLWEQLYENYPDRFMTLAKEGAGPDSLDYTVNTEDHLLAMKLEYPLCVEYRDQVEWYTMDGYGEIQRPMYCRIELATGGPRIYLQTTPQESEPTLFGQWGSYKESYSPEDWEEEDALAWFHKFFMERGKELLVDV